MTSPQANQPPVKAPKVGPPTATKPKAMSPPPVAAPPPPPPVMSESSGIPPPPPPAAGHGWS